MRQPYFGEVPVNFARSCEVTSAQVHNLLLLCLTFYVAIKVVFVLECYLTDIHKGGKQMASIFVVCIILVQTVIDIARGREVSLVMKIWKVNC
jgi:hypothetical protein